MSLMQPLKRGDWVKAVHFESGAVIEAQATHNMATVGYAALELQWGKREGNTVLINTNEWDVTTTKRNLLEPT